MSGEPSQGYLYACQRAELLGQPTPTEEEWLASEERAREREAEEQEEHDNAVAQELNETDDSMKRVGGGLEELTTILNATQKKINKFRTVCGSLGTLLKARVSSQPRTPEHKSCAASSSGEQQQPSASSEVQEQEATSTEDEQQLAMMGDEEQDERQRVAIARKADFNQKLGSHIDKLDSLINKAENAQYSMKHQTKQMKNFLK